MVAPNRLVAASDNGILLIVTGQTDDRLLQRAAFLAASLDTDLEVYCPIVMPPAPHSGTPQQTPPWQSDVSLAREHGRRKAGWIVSFLNEQPVEAHVETGICRSVTEGIVNAADRLKPDLVLLPRPEDHGLLDKPFHAQCEDIWAMIDAPTWILHAGELPGNNVAGLVFLDARSNAATRDDERVVSEASLFARRFESDMHLIACVKQPPALAMAREALAPSRMSASQRREDALVQRVYGLADSYDVPSEQIHMSRELANDTIERSIGPLHLGLVVASGRPQRRLGGLIKQHRAAALIDLQCDVLILGESDVSHA